jgi:asparagine synthase (glutamine-hydrolysing)
MCGICVVTDERRAVDAQVIRRMCDRIRHRGPDAEGLHVDGPVALGMRRLSIIDLSTGDQPIYNEDRSLAIVFNGEIYNYQALREQLLAAGHRFQTASDTETILHLYEEHGLEALSRLRGMFAFAIHDRRSGRVVLARDRLGIKPLHYLETPQVFYAASEIKSLLGLRESDRTLDEVALDQYFSLLYVPAPRTIFRAIRKVPPGHYLIKDRGKPAVLAPYWQLSARPGSPRSDDEWTAEFRRRFDDAVASHLVADVPLGVFLSGGLDSSSMVASMARAGAKIKTFSLGFPDEYRDFDERRYARQVARAFGADHEEVIVEPRIEETIHTLADVFDEPLGDSGAVPNYLVCQAARRGLTVALSGLGGDELAGGYRRHLGVLVADWYRRLPGPLRHGVIRHVVDWLPESRKGLRALDRAKRFVRHAEQPWVDRFFGFVTPLERERRRALYTPALRERVDLDSAAALMHRLADAQPDAELLNRVLAIDLQSYMVDDLLAVADRTSMAVSLEVRVPFLDHHLVEFMAGMPARLKIRGLDQKHVIKRAFRADLPREVLHRRKGGFSLPVARWLREDLDGVVGDVLSPARLRREGTFEPEAVERLRREHRLRQRDWSSVLWALLMFHLWKDRYARDATAG